MSLIKLDEFRKNNRLLKKEKELTKLRDQLTQQRRDLPWERVEKAYTFDGPNGKGFVSVLSGKEEHSTRRFVITCVAHAKRSTFRRMADDLVVCRHGWE